jgi:4'-phosphopantetheinyl transferase
VISAADVVQVWFVRDELPESVLAELSAVLDDEERRRADAFARPADRRRFIVAHGAARFIVGAQLGAPAREIRWERGPHGKPDLAGTWTGAQVNLSHSDSLSMIAVTASRRVGADVQRLAPGTGPAAMANRYFPPEEAGFVLAAEGADGQADRFTRLWVRKEAVVKAAGGRLMQGLPVPVQRPGGAAADDYVADYPDEMLPGRYRVTDVPVPEGFRAAVALSGDQGYDVIQRWWSLPGAIPARPSELMSSSTTSPSRP